MDAMRWGARRPFVSAVVAIVVVGLLTAFGGAGRASALPATAPSAGSPDYTPAGCATLTAAQRNSAVPHARCFALRYTGAAQRQAAPDDAPPASALSPADLRGAYNLPDGGAGRTVAIVDAYGYSTAEADLAEFRAYYGLPACTTANGCFDTVDQRGGSDFPTDDPDWSIEAAMDLDAVSAACPKCHILLVQADSSSFDDLGQGVDAAAARPGVVAISNSYGIDGETQYQSSYDHFYDHPGIAVTVASGDSGNVQSWPATNPTVTAVGGTSLARDSSSRGWHESVWGSADGLDGAGSGCSLYEPAPDWQSAAATTCGTRKATADISADADPATGIGVYNTLGQSGWAQWGGTSLATPLVAAMYALAGTPTPDTYPASYPYQKSGALFDVTDGVNGSCGTKLCQAGPGWDGPTGLGSPNGVTALTQGGVGEIDGTVTDAASAAGLAGVRLTAVDGDGHTFTAVTGADGGYTLAVPAGTYRVTAALLGYAGKTTDGVQVAVDGKVDADFALTELDTETVSGTVTDGSGRGWPMRAEITVAGDPDAVTYSDPYTGHYSLQLPAGTHQVLHAKSADLPGYAEADVAVDLTGSAPAGVDIGLKADQATCTAPGYGYTHTGTTTDFEGWTGTQPQDGWTVTDTAGNGRTWAFDDPTGRGNETGAAGDFATVDYSKGGTTGLVDTSLVSPVTDLSDVQQPEISFNTRFVELGSQKGAVDLSVDGGQTWSSVWTANRLNVGGRVDVPVPAAAGKSQVRVRFHYTADSLGWFWQLDDAFIGDRSCGPVGDGGLVAGVVSDHNTGDGLDGATVTSTTHSDEYAVTEPTPQDANLPDGYYWLFSTHPAATPLTVTDGRYQPTTVTADIPADGVAHTDFDLRSGRLSVQTPSVSATVPMGGSTTRTVTFGNDGTEPVHVHLAETDEGFTQADGRQLGVPKQVVRTKTSVAAMPGTAAAGGTEPADAGTAPSAGAWQPIGNYPSTVMDDAVAQHDGKVYVLGGTVGEALSDRAYVYDTTTAKWTSIARLPEPVNGAAAAFVGDRLYLVGGWNTDGDASNRTFSYDPATDTWTRLAGMPTAASFAGLAVLSGKLYAVGGCTASCAPASKAVYSYDPGDGSWSRQPDYPTPVAFTACAGVGGEIVCAGGADVNANTSLTATHALVPGSGGWSDQADLPVDAWGAGYAAANGRLVVMGGAVGNGSAITNQNFAYDPAADSWSRLPNSSHAVYRGGGTCGLYKVGGSAGAYDVVQYGETLPGWNDCDGDVPWLDEAGTDLVVNPGQTASVTVTLDARDAAVPGDYVAGLDVRTDSPYATKTIDVTMHVTPPASWGKVAGTVTDPAGAPISGATVLICGNWNRQHGCGPVSFTLVTGADGRYQQWLDTSNNALAVNTAKDGYLPQFHVVKIHRGQVTTLDITLAKSS